MEAKEEGRCEEADRGGGCCSEEEVAIGFDCFVGEVAIGEGGSTGGGGVAEEEEVGSGGGKVRVARQGGS